QPRGVPVRDRRGRRRRGMAARLGGQLLAGGPDGRRVRQVAEPGRLQRPGVGLRRGPVDGAGRGGHRCAGLGDRRVAVRAVRVPRQRGVHRQDPVRDAIGVRRSRGEEGLMARNGHPRPDNHVIVLFGATGDLAKRKLLPGLYHLFVAGLLPKGFRIIGSSPHSFACTDEVFRARAKEAVTQFGNTKPDGQWPAFESHLSFAVAEPDNYTDLVNKVQQAEKEIGGTVRRLFHLAIPPVAFSSIVAMLGDAGLANEGAHVIIEKPFGTDLASARELNADVHKVFGEDQIFRIDHFLGKESVDNILAFRFANGLFEPVWNRDHIQYVQIDVPETLSIEGRAAFYDATGAYKDMVVTHLFQVLAFVAMEPPVSLSAKHLRDEKEKVFEALRPLDPRHVVRGQYEGYLDEQGVAAGSATETMVAVRAEVEN